jgi:hypothetical protein
VDDQTADVLCVEQQVGAEWGGVVADGDGAAIGAVAADEVAGLIELTVVRQVNFRHDTEQGAAVDDEGAVVEGAEVA